MAINKKLILEHKKEFDYWVEEDGSLLVKHPTKGWIDYYGEDIWTHKDIKIIRNDEYVELRKLLSEGKTIQYRSGTIFGTKEHAWYDLTPETFFSYKNKDYWDKEFGNIKGSENYRIKPEREFVVGDFVRTCDGEIGVIDSIRGGKNPILVKNTHRFQRLEGFDKKELTIWKEEKGDLLVYPNTDKKSFTCSIFLKIDKYGDWTNCFVFENGDIIKSDLCEPFINDVPIFFKKCIN